MPTGPRQAAVSSVILTAVGVYAAVDGVAHSELKPLDLKHTASSTLLR